MDNLLDYTEHVEYRQHNSVNPLTPPVVFDNWSKIVFTDGVATYYHVSDMIIAVTEKLIPFQPMSLYNAKSEVSCTPVFKWKYAYAWSVGSTSTLGLYVSASLHIGSRLYAVDTDSLIEMSIIGKKDRWDCVLYSASANCRVNDGTFVSNCFGEVVGYSVRVEVDRYIIHPIYSLLNYMRLGTRLVFVGIRFQVEYRISGDIKFCYMRVTKSLNPDIRVGMCIAAMRLGDIPVDVSNPYLSIPDGAIVEVDIIPKLGGIETIEASVVEFDPFRLYKYD